MTLVVHHETKLDGRLIERRVTELQRKEQGMTETVRSTKEVDRELERIDRFRKVASHRANRALNYIEALLRTSDRSRYAYTDEQVAEILDKLRQATDQLAAAYSGSRSARLRVDL